MPPISMHNLGAGTYAAVMEKSMKLHTGMYVLHNVVYCVNVVIALY